MIQPSKAWWVADPEEGTDTIEIASDKDSALNKGAWVLKTEIECCTATPAPEFDQYAGLDYVPVEALLQAGWYFYCYRCDRKVLNDHGYVVEDEDGEYQPTNPYFVANRKILYCGNDCYSSAVAEHKRKIQRRTEAIDRLTKAFPGITDLSACGGEAGFDVYVSFKFPNSLGKVDWSSGSSDSVRIEQRDVEEWNEFVALVRKEGME